MFISNFQFDLTIVGVTTYIFILTGALSWRLFYIHDIQIKRQEGLLATWSLKVVLILILIII